jgi:hypothetical protein
MWLEAIITQEDLVQFLTEFLPVRMPLGNETGKERWLWLDRHIETSLVPDEGLRVLCPAELCWSIAGMSPTIKLHTLEFLIRPQVVEKNKGPVLEFNFEIMEADIRGVPGVIDAAIVKAVNAVLAEKRLLWNFTDTFSRFVDLPETFEPVDGLKIGVAWGKTRIGPEAIAFVVSFKLGAVRDD